MKLSISNTFDFSTIAGSKAAQELKPFIDHYNRSLDEIVRLLKGRITFQDNLYGQLVTAELVHNSEAKIAVDRSQVLGVIPLKVLNSSDALLSLASSVNQEGQLLVTPTFKLAQSIKLNVTLFILFQSEG